MQKNYFPTLTSPLLDRPIRSLLQQAKYRALSLGETQYLIWTEVTDDENTLALSWTIG